MRCRNECRWTLPLLAGVLLLFSSAAEIRADIPVFSQTQAERAKSQPLPELQDFQIGWQGKYRVGDPAEVRFKLASKAQYQGIVYVLVQDADGNEVRYGPMQHTRFIVTAPRAPFQVTIELRVVPLGDADVERRFREKRDFLEFPVDARWTRSGITADAIGSTRETWLELGPSLNLRNTLALASRDSINLPTIVSNPGYYNKDFYDYRGFAQVILTSPIAPADRDSGPGLDVYNVEDWVREGGQLLLVLYDNKQKPPSGYRTEEVWSKLLPGRLTEERIPHTQFGVWQNYLGTEETLSVNEEQRRNPPLIPVLSNLQGKVLLADGETPLVIEHQLGLGRVVTCLVDLNAEPWRSWKKRDELLQRLIPGHSTTAADAKFTSSSSSLRLGYDDLAGQFVTALGTFESVRLTPFWILMSAALVFGAVWYFLQSALLKTWSATARLSIAAIVVTAATLGFAMLAGGGAVQERLLANSAQVVDYNAAQGEYLGQAWLSLMSSNPREIDLRVDVALPEVAKPQVGSKIEQKLEWLGMPGKGWGGLDAPLATWTQAGEPYRIDFRGTSAQGLTLSPDLTKSFHELWKFPTPAKKTTPLVSHSGESLPRGKFKSELPFALKDAILLYDTWGVELGTIQPGQEIDLEEVRSRVTAAQTIITGKRAQPTAPVQSYDRTNTDISQILKLLLLHRAAGGTRYTGLFSRAWPLLDQSASLTEGQALIFGSGPAPVKWNIGPAGEEPEPMDLASDVCWYRLWFPVMPSEQAAESMSDPTLIRLPRE